MTGQKLKMIHVTQHLWTQAFSHTHVRRNASASTSPPKQYARSQFVEAALVKGNGKTIVLPKYVMEWAAVNGPANQGFDTSA